MFQICFLLGFELINFQRWRKNVLVEWKNILPKNLLFNKRDLFETALHCCLWKDKIILKLKWGEKRGVKRTKQKHCSIADMYTNCISTATAVVSNPMSPSCSKNITNILKRKASLTLFLSTDDFIMRLKAIFNLPQKRAVFWEPFHSMIIIWNTNFKWDKNRFKSNETISVMVVFNKAELGIRNDSLQLIMIFYYDHETKKF